MKFIRENKYYHSFDCPSEYRGESGTERIAYIFASQVVFEREKKIRFKEKFSGIKKILLRAVTEKIQ